MENNENDIQVRDQQTDLAQQNHEPIPADAPLMTRLAMMMERGIKIDTDQMKQMLEIARIVKGDAAKEAYAADFAVVQANIDGAIKTAYNPQTKSNYAKLEGVIEASKPAYTEQGFSVVFSEGETEVKDHIRVCADVLHRDGHKEHYHYDVPLGGVGIAGKVNMTAIHAKATSVTYGRRYLLCMIWNIPTEDNDGNPPKDDTPKGVPKPTAEQQAFIDAVLENLPHVAGMMYNAERLGKYLYALNNNVHCYNMDSVEGAVERVKTKGTPELYMDKLSDFEKNNNLPGDEDSVPDN